MQDSSQRFEEKANFSSTVSQNRTNESSKVIKVPDFCEKCLRQKSFSQKLEIFMQ